MADESTRKIQARFVRDVQAALSEWLLRQSSGLGAVSANIKAANKLGVAPDLLEGLISGRKRLGYRRAYEIATRLNSVVGRPVCQLPVQEPKRGGVKYEPNLEFVRFLQQPVNGSIDVPLNDKSSLHLYYAPREVALELQREIIALEKRVLAALPARRGNPTDEEVFLFGYVQPKI